tara:strand:+ start:12292 stop:14007 length:1716 start_codon:yes stop_codon:yes gene_type:complete
MYFHYIKALSNLSFNNIFHPNLLSNKFLIIPIGSTFLHSIFLKTFGILSFIFFEFFCIFIFLLIFFLIFKELKISDQSAILFTLLIFIVPTFLSKINFLKIDEINTFVNNFYNLRFPRPLVASLYLYCFFYILIIGTKDNLFKLKYLLSIFVLFGLTLSSFFFIFILQFLAFIGVLLKEYKHKLFIKLIKNYKNIIGSLLIFIILISPFIYLLLNTSENYLQRLGLTDISLDDKIYLIKHYLYKLLRPKILLLYLIIIIFYFVITKKFSNHIKIIDIFLIFFLSSIFSPIFYIIFFSKITFLYHFNNLVVITAIILLTMMSIVICSKIIYLCEKKKYYNFFNTILLLIILSFYIFSEINNYFLNDTKKEVRNERIEIINQIKKNKNIKIDKINLLTFDTKFMSWAIMSSISSLKITDGTFTVKKDKEIEDDLIEVFKFLELNRNDFHHFIKNKKIGYRYINHDVRMLFWQKYQANSLFTFKNSKNYDDQTLKFINNSSPFYSHQFAIPKEEISRLLDKFDFIKDNFNYKPDIIILDNEHKILSRAYTNKDDYCKSYVGKRFTLLTLKKFCS